MTTQQEINKFIYLPIYLSDYVSQSRKLTMLQRGAFIDLSVLYFQENLKLNYSKEQIYRMVFAFEKEEREAVDFILDNYFIKSENKPTGFSWVSNQLNEIGDKVLKKLNASRENGKKGGRGNKSENKPIGYNSLNLEKTILNESKLNETKLSENNNNLNNNKSDLKEIIKQAISKSEANASNCKQKVANLADSKNDNVNKNVNHNHNSKTQEISKSEAKPKQAISKTEASELDLFCDEVVIGLKEILSKKLNRNISTSNWSKEIKLIVNNDLKIRGEQQAKQDLIRCIQAIENHYGKDYFPIIQSAKSLREKLTKIENYLERTPQAKKDKLEEDFMEMVNNNKGEF